MFKSILLILGTSIIHLCYGSSFLFTAWDMAGFRPVIAGWSVDATTAYTRANLISSVLLAVAAMFALIYKKNEEA